MSATVRDMISCSDCGKPRIFLDKKLNQAEAEYVLTSPVQVTSLLNTMLPNVVFLLSTTSVVAKNRCKTLPYKMPTLVMVAIANTQTFTCCSLTYRFDHV